MAKLIYSAITSLDGYIADENGDFDWSAPDEEVHAFVNDLERPIGTYLYGRRMYDVMVAWETMHTQPDQPPVMRDYTQIWQAADKVVYSTTLETASSARTRIERDFDPDAVRQLVAEADSDVSIGGPGTRRAGDRGRAGRRVPPVRLTRRGGRRHGGAARRRPPGARAGVRAPVRQRRRPPALPASGLAPLSARGCARASSRVRCSRSRRAATSSAVRLPCRVSVRSSERNHSMDRSTSARNGSPLGRVADRASRPAARLSRRTSLAAALSSERRSRDRPADLGADLGREVAHRAGDLLLQVVQVALPLG